VMKLVLCSQKWCRTYTNSKNWWNCGTCVYGSSREV